jgi:hypothetical protein
MIAEAADRQGLSLRQLAKHAGRDEASVRRTFDVRRKPQRRTIDVLASAAGLFPKVLHAELNDFTPAECDEQCRLLLNWLKGDEFGSDGTAFTQPYDVAQKKIWAAFRSSPPEARMAAVRAWILWGGAGPNEFGLRRFIDALGVPALKALVREEAPGDNALHLTARNLAYLFDFDDSEICRLMVPIIRTLRKRDPKRVSAMIEYAANAPYHPINLEDKIK